MLQNLRQIILQITYAPKLSLTYRRAKKTGFHLSRRIFEENYLVTLKM